jgi:thymidylate synthase ThyX
VLAKQRVAAGLRSCNEASRTVYVTEIVGVSFSGRKPAFKVTLEDGRAIVATKDHLFLTNHGWSRLDDAIQSSSTMFATSSMTDAKASAVKFMGVATVEYVGLRETYDVEVSGPYHNFVANGFIVHNSRNSASSRAVPTNRMIERVLSDPAMPLEWGVNKPGMSASDALTPEQAEEAKAEWLHARDSAVEHVRALQKFNVHKQVINRVLEPFMWHTVIVTATEWDNFFTLRCAPNAQPEIRAAALAMRAALDGSTPRPVARGEWHLPLIQDDERSLPIEKLKRVSAARCARVSYLTHDGARDIEKDVELCDRLWSDRHLSPFEHVAIPSGDAEFHANFRGWVQMRRELETGVPARGV